MNTKKLLEWHTFINLYIYLPIPLLQLYIYTLNSGLTFIRPQRCRRELIFGTFSCQFLLFSSPDCC